MHISEKYKYIAYLSIVTGFIMIAVICMITKNRIKSSNKDGIYLVERSGSAKIHIKNKVLLFNHNGDKACKIQKKMR